MLSLIKEKWKKFLILIGVATGLFLLYMLININYNSFSVLVYYIDGFSFAGGIMLCFGMFSVLNHHGAFDFVSYVFANKNTNHGKLTFGEYIENRETKQKKKKHVSSPYFIIGLLFLMVSAIMFIVLESQMAM